MLEKFLETKKNVRKTPQGISGFLRRSVDEFYEKSTWSGVGIIAGFFFFEKRSPTATTREFGWKISEKISGRNPTID